MRLSDDAKGSVSKFGFATKYMKSTIITGEKLKYYRRNNVDSEKIVC